MFLAWSSWRAAMSFSASAVMFCPPCSTKVVVEWFANASSWLRGDMPSVHEGSQRSTIEPGGAAASSGPPPGWGAVSVGAVWAGCGAQ